MGKMLPRKMNISHLLIGLVISCCVTSEIVAASDIECYQCAGEDCEDPELITCNAAASESDQCYVRIDGNYDIIGMGCASALGDEMAITELIKNKELYVCSTSNCNGFENLPESNECTKCNSSTDEKCAIQPKLAGTKSRCGVLPYTQCYERVSVKNGGTTERGCLFDLASEEFYNCVSGQDKNCKICGESGCNTEIIPANRHQCQRCNSETDSSCNSSPSALSVCPTYVENDSCVSLYESGVTQRGCASELRCNTTSRNCQICTSSGCNIGDMKARSEELYGIFQDLPLNCNTCSGEECQENRQNLRKCQGNIYQDCLSVFDTDGTLVARGCEDTLDTEYLTHCDTHSSLCFNCKSNGCNDITTVPQTIDCIYCDTTSKPDCLNNIQALSNTRTCVEGCVTSLYENKSNPNLLELARTCFEDLEFDDRETCTKENNCVKCTDEECNTDLLPTDGRLSCLHCDGANCDEPIPLLCNSYWSTDQCYIYFDAVTHSAVRMGCKSSLPTDAILNDVLHYFVCDGDDCNSYANLPEAHFCYVCNSADNFDCIANPTSLESAVRCQINPHTDCYSRVTDDGHTERGCTSSLNNTEFLTCHQGTPGEYCRICTDNYCNRNSYPSGRQQCYRCNSADDPSCETAPTYTSVCPIFDEDDYCVTKWIDGIIYRGCGSELQCDQNSTHKNCRSCENFYCNTDVLEGEYPIGNPGMFQDLPLNCYQCNGTEDCGGESLGKLQKCDGNIYQTCTTVFNTNNGSIIGRGCSDAYVETCDNGTNNCYNCKSNGCNVATSESNYISCIFCDGKTNGDCVADVAVVRSNRKCYESCVTTLYNRTNDASPVQEVVRTCLDDLELDEREACAAGNDENCKVCSTNKCNTDIVGTHISCYQCVGDECQVPTAKACRAVSETDQCFVRYDEKYSIVELGCKSNYDEAEVKELIMAKLLWLCEGENCNTIDVSPAAQTCSICSSLTDKDCAVAPSSVKATTSCAKLPYTQCYSRILENGHTERGCLSSIEGEDFYDCLVGTNTTKCLACDGKSCNAKIFPADRRSCHQCNSLEDPTCENTPEASAVCLLYHAEESCTVKLIDDITYRGCSSDLTCDSSDRQTCRQCSSKDNCNIADLSSLNIGEPGKWQGLPLNCYDCEGDECATSNGVLRKCQLNDLQTCQTVFGSNDQVVKRGCSDDVESTYEEYCAENPTKCLGCKSNGCNNATSLDQYIDCYACDAAQSPNCALNFEGDGTGVKTRKCQGHCAIALYPRSSAANPAYELERTCLDDMDLDDREVCLSGENELCAACDRDLCNIETIPENRHKCYHCTEEDCAEYEVAPCNAYKANDQCYMSFDDENSILGMGCRSEFEDDVIEDLIKQKKFIFCDGAACNGPETIPMSKICTVCDSKTDPRCATNPNLVTDVERCIALPYTECYTRVQEDGHTARGCLSTLEGDTFYGCLIGNDTLCQTCAADKCNSLDVFPSDRWTCHQCNSEDDPLCVNAPNSNKVCPIYSDRESCVTNYNNGVTTRGCESSLQCDNANDNSTCRTCNTPGCNTINLDRIQSQGKPGRWQDVPITCGTCEGEENCSSIGSYRVCTGNLYQSCMTIFNTAGKVIQRGCSDALEEANYDFCEGSPDNCMRCNSNGCNNATQLTDYIDCLYCDTDTNGNCVEKVGDVRKTRKCNKYCMTGLYAKYDEPNPAYGLSRSCFDDMDYDEREACAAGELKHCHVCDQEKCNTQLVPAMRLSCMTCKDGDCQDPQPNTCATYRPDDQCYIKFDEQGSVNGMGCRSEFSNAEADYLLSQQRLFFCGGDNCNTYDSIPETQTCMICSSRTDINCAVWPEELTASTKCARAPYTDCYTRVLPSGVTERGCLSSLYDDEFVSCFNGTSNTCNTCSGSYCNQDIFPENRLSCHICDSTKDSKCVYKPNSVSLCPLYAENDKCVTAYINDVTYRGCSSSIQCDATQPNSCVQCVGAACNTINLERKQDDNHGKWQDLPLTCLSCSGESCSNNVNIESITCENNNDQDCMTVFEGDNVVRRGCSDIVEVEYDEYCENDWSKCPNCKSNNCNNATSLSQYTQCIYCDTNKNQSCLWAPRSATHKIRQCQGSCMTALYPSDGSSDPVYELIRTCLDDKEANDQLACVNGKDGKCQSCEGTQCNTADVPAERQSCYQCMGDDCEEPQLKICPLYKSTDQCFTTFDESNTVIQMGCISSFRNQLLETIIGTKRIQVCDGVGCNSLDTLPIAHKCAVCNSNEDYTCATNAQEVGSFSMCSQYPYTNCYTKLISSDGSTTRGCLADLSTSDFVNCVLGNDKNCSICIGDGCNREVFPADRQQCYTCSSEDDADCESNPKRLLSCPYLTDTEKCRTAYGGNVTVRGCSSEVYCDINDRNTCRSCIGTGCNSIDLAHRVENDDGNHGVWQDLPLRCHTCEGEHCLYSLGPAYNCSGNMEQDCATVFTTDGEVKRRGCADDVEDYEQRHCRQYPHLCFTCKSNECNDAWNITEYVQCNYCTSETDESCVIDPVHGVFTKRQCKQECMVAMKDSHVIRSCLDDKEENQRYVCRGDFGDQECSSCNTDDCNNFVYPKDRLSCHVCNDASCRTTVVQYCPNYVSNDFCFAKYENGNVDLMGCGSSQNSNDLTQWEAQKKLYTCRGNNCNDLQQLPSSSGKCLSCNSANAPACAQNPFGYTVTESCPPLQNQCVTYLDEEGHTLRGCLSKLSENEQSSCQASGKCAICTGDNCNFEIFPSNRLSCHICSSGGDSSCSTSPNHLQVCPIYSLNDRCVTKRSEHIERGCQSELTCDSNDESLCQICDGNGCNIAELTDAALISTASLLTTLILAMLAVLGHRYT